MTSYSLTRGTTGLEVQTSDGALIGHVCHSDEVGAVLDMLLAQFPAEVAHWLTARLNDGAPGPQEGT